MSEVVVANLRVTAALQQLLWSQIECYADAEPALAALRNVRPGETASLSETDARYLSRLLTEVAVDPLTKYDGITPGEVRCAKTAIAQLEPAAPHVTP